VLRLPSPAYFPVHRVHCPKPQPPLLSHGFPSLLPAPASEPVYLAPRKQRNPTTPSPPSRAGGSRPANCHRVASFREGRTVPTATVSILDGDSLPGLLPQPPPFSHGSESKAPWVEQGYLRQWLAGSIVSPGHSGTTHGIVAMAVSLERDPAAGTSTQGPKAQDDRTVAWRAHEAIRRPATVSGGDAVLCYVALGSDGVLCCARGDVVAHCRPPEMPHIPIIYQVIRIVKPANPRSMGKRQPTGFLRRLSYTILRGRYWIASAKCGVSTRSAPARPALRAAKGWRSCAPA